MATVKVGRTINAPLDDVWREVSAFDHSLGSIDIAVTKPGNPAMNGVGCERTLTFGKQKIQELIEDVEPKRSFSYSILSGVPAKYYHGYAEFLSNGNKTAIQWTQEFKPRIPGSGWLIKRTAKRNLNTLISELESSANRHSSIT